MFHAQYNIEHKNVLLPTYFAKFRQSSQGEKNENKITALD